MNKPGNPPFSSRSLARPVSELIRPVLGEALKAQGFASADILALWPEIVGERLAARSMPVRLLWPPRLKTAPPQSTPDAATLILKVESAFAWEVEMGAAQIIERINAVFGWRCIGRLRLRQGPVETLTGKPVRQPLHLTADQEKRLRQTLAAIDEEGLKAALHRLGEGILTQKSRKEP